ncbi:aldo/keto reductase [Gleimia hominis]|uniref:aldo/keto reductase n=1 Tax=Gleimia hominis TaxID=595468 RepID=UPI000C806698|nr:aldo/keto reductase [Gleimia hominis]WIK64993.1 aldo/keto reductase [Gleimia hominis]
MQQVRLGSSGLQVSNFGLGTLTWGQDTTEDEATRILHAYADAGGTTIDTAPTYGGGESEATLGNVLAQDFNREDFTLITKGGFANHPHWRHSNARGTLLASIDRSLKHLQTDYIDLFLLQGSDAHAPIEETLSAIDIAARTGRVRYFGVSNMSAWDTAEVFYLARQLSIPMSAVEAEYSVLRRGVERELLPACKRHGIGFIAWSALARGVLTGKYRHATPADSRGASPLLAGFVQPLLTEQNASAVEGVFAAAKGLDASPIEVALGWLKAQTGVTCSLIGPRTEIQMQQVAAGLDFELPQPLVQAVSDLLPVIRDYPEVGVQSSSPSSS